MIETPAVKDILHYFRERLAEKFNLSAQEADEFVSKKKILFVTDINRTLESDGKLRVDYHAALKLYNQKPNIDVFLASQNEDIETVKTIGIDESLTKNFLDKSDPVAFLTNLRERMSPYDAVFFVDDNKIMRMSLAPTEELKGKLITFDIADALNLAA